MFPFPPFPFHKIQGPCPRLKPKDILLTFHIPKDFFCLFQLLSPYPHINMSYGYDYDIKYKQKERVSRMGFPALDTI